MKKLSLIMLLATLPFLTMAQKRSKKVKVDQTEASNSNASYEFMVISGHSMNSSRIAGAGPNADTRSAKMSSIKITFDLGGIASSEAEDLSQMQYRSMAHAVNIAAKLGWEFVSANVLDKQASTLHFYYMKRKR